MKAKAKKQVKAPAKVLKAIDDVTGDLLCLLDLGKAYRDYPDHEGITGYTLAASVEAIGGRVFDALEKLPDYEACQNAKEADEMLGEAQYILRALWEILNELSHDSDDWDQNRKVDVGYMTFCMALDAARKVEMAAHLLGGNGFGFSAPNYGMD